MSATANPAHGKWLMAAVSMSLFCVQIDYFAMNLALPRIATDFSSTATDLQWIVSIYMVTLGALMVPAGRLADIFGRKRALLTGIAVFGLASLLRHRVIGCNSGGLPCPSGCRRGADLSRISQRDYQRISRGAGGSDDRTGVRHCRSG